MRSVAEDVEAIGRISAVPMILEVVARTTGMRFTAIARVTDQSWTACAIHDEIEFGLKPGDELKLETTICNEIRQQRVPVMFDQASVHPSFKNHPTPKLYNFESYISVPIFHKDGELFGTLCAIDPQPAKLTPNVMKTLELFAQLIASHLDMERELSRSTQALAYAEDTALLREQFIAVLGHDLRNPLNSVSLAMDVLDKKLTDSSLLSIVRVARRSCGRMTSLIENVLDFARGKLGGGIPVVAESNTQLAGELRQVIAEIAAAHPERELKISIDLPYPTHCDSHRIGQMLGNLLANAITHGARDEPVQVMARSDEDIFQMSVTNGGPCITESVMAKLFEPFSRSSSGAPHDGLGLGLYIASEIAKGHRGKLQVSSNDEGGTCFVFQMPRQ